jgi:hypothetical protein
LLLSVLRLTACWSLLLLLLVLLLVVVVLVAGRLAFSLGVLP